MTYLAILFVPPLYFLSRKKWGGFVLNSFIFGCAFLMVATIVLALAAPIFWVLAVGHAAFAYRNEFAEKHATMVATKMAEQLRSAAPSALPPRHKTPPIPPTTTIMKSILALLAVCALIATGCATPPPQPRFSAESVNQITSGMSKEQVITLLGEPRSRSSDNQGNETWQYRKNADQGKGMKTFTDVVSFGMTAGMESDYQDILSVMFQNGAVSKVTYQENVHVLTGLNQR